VAPNEHVEPGSVVGQHTTILGRAGASRESNRPTAASFLHVRKGMAPGRKPRGTSVLQPGGTRDRRGSLSRKTGPGSCQPGSSKHVLQDPILNSEHRGSQENRGQRPVFPSLLTTSAIRSGPVVRMMHTLSLGDQSSLVSGTSVAVTARIVPVSAVCIAKEIQVFVPAYCHGSIHCGEWPATLGARKIHDVSSFLALHSLSPVGNDPRCCGAPCWFVAHPFPLEARQLPNNPSTVQCLGTKIMPTRAHLVFLGNAKSYLQPPSWCTERGGKKNQTSGNEVPRREDQIGSGAAGWPSPSPKRTGSISI
jgi:hypothetical protein